MKTPSGRLFVLLALLFAAQITSVLAQTAASPTREDDGHVKIILDCFAIVISLVALFVSWRAIKRASAVHEQSTRRTSRETHMKMLFDVGQLLVTSPKLWTLYDTHGLAKNRDTSPEAIATREAFFYQHLNIFDLVWDFYTNLIKRDDVDQDHWESWKRYMRQFFRESSEARRLFSEPRTREIFSKRFVEFIDDVIKSVS